MLVPSVFGLDRFHLYIQIKRECWSFKWTAISINIFVDINTCRVYPELEMDS